MEKSPQLPPRSWRGDSPSQATGDTKPKDLVAVAIPFFFFLVLLLSCSQVSKKESQSERDSVHKQQTSQGVVRFMHLTKVVFLFFLVETGSTM